MKFKPTERVPTTITSNELRLVLAICREVPQAAVWIPIPNPGSIQELKVQTALYDAEFGPYGGADLSLLTKTARR